MKKNEKDIVHILAQERKEPPEKSTEDLKRNTVAALACKKSIKAHDRLKNEEAIRLIEDLKKAKDSLHCPHGRPTLLYFSKHDIARRFGRTNPV